MAMAKEKKLIKGSNREQIWLAFSPKTFKPIKTIQAVLPDIKHLSTCVAQLHKTGWLEVDNKGKVNTYRRLTVRNVPDARPVSKENNINKLSAIATQAKNVINNNNPRIITDDTLERLQQSGILDAQPISLGALIEQVQAVQQQNAIYKQGFETIAHVLEQMNILESD